MSTAVSSNTYLNDLKNIPAELTRRHNWVVWSNDSTNDAKSKKVPHRAHGGRLGGEAKSNDPSSWCSFDEAVTAARSRPNLVRGVGFQFGLPEARCGIVGIDLDDCDITDGGWSLFAKWLTDEFSSFTEKSQSGTGRHIFARGTLPSAVKIDKGETAGIKHRALEMYDHSRYFAMTGTRVGEVGEAAVVGGIREAQELVTALHTALGHYDRILKWVKRTKLSDEKRAEEFVKLWNGTEKSESLSNGDWKLCGTLLRWADGDWKVADILFRLSGRYVKRAESSKDWDDRRHGSNAHSETGEPLYLDRPVTDELTYGELTLGKQLYEWRKRKGDRAKLERQVQGENPHILGEAALTEIGNAECFAALNRGRLIWNATNKVWMAWDGTKWVEDHTGQAQRTARETLKLRAQYAKMMDDDEAGSLLYIFVTSPGCERRRHIDDLLVTAATFEGMSVEQKAFDTNADLLCAANGVYHLGTHEFRGAHPEDMVSKQLGAAYDPMADCPRWRQFVREIFAGDEATVAYMQRAFGYALTTSTKEQVMFLLSGLGSNGKSLLLNTVAKVMGTYRGAASFEAFEARDGGSSGHSEALADLAGKRYVTIIESNEGKRLNEARVKVCTGGDTVSASRKYGHVFNFTLFGKIFLAVNRKPRIVGTDKGIWRRIHLVEFSQTFEGESADQDLEQKLEAELSGILNWLLEGLREWQRIGLARPEALTATVNAYKEESDSIANWLEECCVIDPNVKCPTDDAYASYKVWSERMGEFTFSRVVWLERMKEHGYERQKLYIKTGIGAEERVKRWHLLGVKAEPDIRV